MKSFLQLRTVAASFRSTRFIQRAALSGVALASLFAASPSYGQGQYYPVNPPGGTYGSTYTGITTNSNPDLRYLQGAVQTLYGPLVTLQVPTPTGSSLPTTAQFSAAVAICTQAVLNGSSPAGITLASLSNEAVAWRPADRAATATTIAQNIVSTNPATAVTNLISVTNGLALSQPTLIDSIMPSILAQAGTMSTVALGIPQIVAAAISDIPRDLTRIGTIVNSGLGAISASSLSATQKTNIFLAPTYLGAPGFVNSVLHSTAANNNPAVINSISRTITSGGYFSMVPPAGGMTALDQILASSVANLPTSSNFTLGALTSGALASQGGANAAAIKTDLATDAPGFATYTGAVVDGYTNSASLAAFQAYIAANPTVADAAVSGAITKGAVASSTLLTNALTNGSTTSATNTVASAIYANVTNGMSTLTGAINTSTHTPYGPAGTTFANIALGAAEAMPIENIGNAVQTIILNSAASVTALSSATVNSIVDQAIVGATAANNAGAYADIVYKAETQAKSTSAASAPLVKQAIDSIFANAADPTSSYLAAVSAVAGDTTQANFAAIKAQADAELPTHGGDVTAADAGMAVVAAIRSNVTTTYTKTLTAFNTAASTTSVIADVYGAVLANPSETDAALAAAIKQTSVSPTLLTTAASNAIRGSNATLDPTLQMVQTVVTHIKNESVAGTIQDLFDFVGHQITIAPSLTKDIAIAATVVDPDHAHYISHAVAFQNPMSAFSSVGVIFTYAQITNPTPLTLPTGGNPTGAIGTKPTPGKIGTIIDQPAAAAAITAGLTTGILEANLSAANTQTALSTAVAAAVTASLTQNGTLLRGPTSPFFTGTIVTAGSFQQSDGGVGTSTGAQTVGAAGAITGYIAQVTQPTDTTISAITKAVLTAAVGGGARPYALQMAQAAGQALAWVANANFNVGNPNNATYTAQAASDIANAMLPSVTGFATLAQLINAATFGINQAEAGVIGAGALGLNAKNMNNSNGTVTVLPTGNNNADFYIHRSATGLPVTDIFNL